MAKEPKQTRYTSSVQSSSGGILNAYRKTEASLNDGAPTVASTIGTYTSAIKSANSELRELQNKVKEFVEPVIKPVSRADASGASNLSSAGTGWEETAYNLVASKEGYEENAYFDKSLSGNLDGYRIGFGSGTITRDGKVIKVTENSVVTRGEAEADLVRRLNTEFGPRAKRAAGKGWDTLSNNSKAALTSVVYNAGNLPKSIKDAVRSGNRAAVAEAIRNSGAGTVLELRRIAEAELYLLPDASNSTENSSNSLVERRNK